MVDPRSRLTRTLELLLQTLSLEPERGKFAHGAIVGLTRAGKTLVAVERQRLCARRRRPRVVGQQMLGALLACQVVQFVLTNEQPLLLGIWRIELQ